MRRCYSLSLCSLALIVILVTGCTQPGTDPQKAVTPAPAVAGSSAGEISPQTTTSQITRLASPAVTVTEVQKRGTPDPDFIVDISVPEKIWPGTTILPDNHDAAHPRIIEVNQLGEIVWEYPLPDELKSYTNPGWDVEVLQNGNILTLLPRNGVYEINRDKQVVWKYIDSKVSHDADRIGNGNTLIAFGGGDTAGDAQVKEIDPDGKRVWSWYAKDVFTGAEYTGISNEGWTHTNAVSRLESGNTLISLRNFNVIVEVDRNGKLVRTIGKGLFEAQHDPLVLSNGKLLVANHVEPHEILELDPYGAVIWRYTIMRKGSWPVRDANRLPNGNTLITASDRIIEVTPDLQVVWQFRLVAGPFTDKTAPARGFYKAERISG
ncbi:MAG: aryl-sulfate sulfotransferase [Methanoregula sp.]|nr:MAG: aryl-sulfate sulfotransferase [Methanoregula sp.]